MSTEKRKLIAIETDDDSSASSDSGSESDVSLL